MTRTLLVPESEINLQFIERWVDDLLNTSYVYLTVTDNP
jgi:hypothetical protein